MTKTSESIDSTIGIKSHETQAVLTETNSNSGQIVDSEIEKKNDLQILSVDNQLSKEVCLLSKTEHNIRNSIKNGIKLAEPLVFLNGLPLFRRGILYSVQGQKGSHKTRIASRIATSILKGSAEPDSIGFSSNPNEDVTIVYLNTEMNDLEEFAPIVRKIQQDSGLDVSNPKFRFASLIETNRSNRLYAIINYIQQISLESKNHIVLFIDVITDLVADFNNVVETNQVLDFFAVLRTHFNCTIIQVIHENPGTTKARGNLGTEIGNKSSGQLRVGFEYKNFQKTSRIFLEVAKIRGLKGLPTIYLEFSEELGDLVLAKDQNKLKSIEDSSKFKISEIAKILSEIMLEDRKYTQSELIDEIQKRIPISPGTVKTRLNLLIGSNTQIVSCDGSIWNLESHVQNGSKTEYSLVLIKNS